ncbi:hypothetical protein Pelo_17964 [Pelomyxa schiedti]|nr:hypothetical protein Pelo_17964 [Pelomyxa schiedti]
MSLVDITTGVWWINESAQGHSGIITEILADILSDLPQFDRHVDDTLLKFRALSGKVPAELYANCSTCPTALCFLGGGLLHAMWRAPAAASWRYWKTLHW